MISIAPPQYDPDGALVFRQGATVKAPAARRVTQVATLDGGAILADGGFSHGDRTLTVTVPGATLAQIQRVQQLQRTYPELLLSWAEGIFNGAIAKTGEDNGELTVTFLVKERIAGA